MCNLGVGGFLKAERYESDPTHKQPVNWQRIEQHMNVFRLAQIAKKVSIIIYRSNEFPRRCAALPCFSGGKYFFQSAIVKCHHSVRKPQNPALMHGPLQQTYVRADSETGLDNATSRPA